MTLGYLSGIALRDGEGGWHMSRRIIVSDLHIDTWRDEEVGQTGKSRFRHFCDLLDWCKQVRVDEFIINGDLMNLPPLDGQCAFPPGHCIARDVIERLVWLASEEPAVPITYVFGNHDIGVSGFRSLGEHSIGMLRNANFCYPDYRLDYHAPDGKPATTILIEHGHFYDPVLVLYLRDLVDRTFMESRFEAFQWAMQRRDVDPPSKPTKPGAQIPVPVRPGENAYTAMKASGSPQKANRYSTRKALKELGRELVEPYQLGNWRRAASREMQQFISKRAKAREPVAPLVQIIFGHTHRTDKVEDIALGNGIKGTYLNSGSWAQEFDQGPYLDVRDGGVIWLQDWINEDARTKRLYSD